MAKPRRRPKSTNGIPAQVPELASAQRDQSPIQILREIQEGRLDPSRLTKDQRRSILLVLSHGSHTKSELAEILRVNASTIASDMRHLRKHVGQLP